ncbi:type III secretion system inner rod subunit SctI [unidentified bacterial endosymbiont]|uniref:type III secretion system inner rod subunit SctI n=1 Tax=unidentified bacterial endosymbiont TaxID=2355 RepID=UPI00209E0F5B|nr:type III secretion system inner rod subunit SctI [unidentified bacterial endosymbiont]
MNITESVAMHNAAGYSETAPVTPITSDHAVLFNKLLAGSHHNPVQMLTRQAEIMSATVEVELGAKIAGAVSQSVNKLASMS